LERLLREEGSEGRKKLDQYTYLLALPMAARLPSRPGSTPPWPPGEAHAS